MDQIAFPGTKPRVLFLGNMIFFSPLSAATARPNFDFTRAL